MLSKPLTSFGVVSVDANVGVETDSTPPPPPNQEGAVQQDLVKSRVVPYLVGHFYAMKAYSMVISICLQYRRREMNVC